MSMYICRNCRSALTQSEASFRRYSILKPFPIHSRSRRRDADSPEGSRVRRVSTVPNGDLGENIQEQGYSPSLVRSRSGPAKALLCSSHSGAEKKMFNYRCEVGTAQYRNVCASSARSQDGDVAPIHNRNSGILEDLTRNRPVNKREHLRKARALQSRHFHTTSLMRQTSNAAVQNQSAIPDVFVDRFKNVREGKKGGRQSGIRAELNAWRILHADDEANYRQVDFEQEYDLSGPHNDFSRLSTTGPAAARREQFSGDEGEDHPSDLFMNSTGTDLDEAPMSKRFLSMGDLVELPSLGSDREAVIAVFVRRAGNMAQFFTAQGRWTYREEKAIQYSIPNWISRTLVEPLIEHIPDLEQVQSLQKLLDDAYLYDLSVPRRTSAPLVTRMQQFHTESRDIYRRHAEALDNAHDILAHNTELRHGSLMSVASTLLGMPSDKLPIAALWTTRSALTRAGFAFAFDPRSHRLTGNMQILPKQQVKKVKDVREWFRAWQDDLARVSRMSHSQRSRHRPAKGAQHMYSFVDKAQRIVKKSRKHRMPTACGSVGPSKERYTITPQSDSVRIKTDVQFSQHDAAILQFMQDWCCSFQLDSQPQLLSLPPLLLQSIGLYQDYGFKKLTGFVFLQELGALLPYENRVTFDPHLSLATAQKMMDSLTARENSHDLQDSMAHIRKDWKDLPVFCIDAEGSQEIDDGMSIEWCGSGPDGREQYWVHVHIANPTAFFSKDHPLAEMARHLTETIYTPERNQSMLPRWVTSNHFSLEKDRPCLTFSAKMDLDGNTLEHKIAPGIVRNVFHLSHEKVAELLGMKNPTKANQIVMTVGGDPPPQSKRTSRIADITTETAEQLRKLAYFAQKRSAIRKASGGLFLDLNRPDARVWQSWSGTGLSLQPPYKLGSRTVEGDPVIQVTTSGLSNWYNAVEDETYVLVQEIMLLACNIGASWCAERHIPFIYRGTKRRPDSEDPEKFLREILEPAAMKSPNGEWPLYRAHEYVTSFGYTVLTTEPLKNRVLGMSHYGKVTSPLRRYGDMVVHWQIGAALLEEARTGHSLIRKPKQDVEPSFLPFSKENLESTLVDLQSRENLIMRAKQYSQDFWIHMLLFRAVHFGETEVPLFLAPVASRTAVRGGLPRKYDPERRRGVPLAHSSNQRYVLRVYIHSVPKAHGEYVVGMTMEFNTSAHMIRPHDIGLAAAQHGDVWEAQIEEVNPFMRGMILWPTRLLERDGQTVDS